MATYRVIWEIDIEADSPQEAASEAAAIQTDPESIATVFTVSCGDQKWDVDTADGVSFVESHPGYCASTKD